MFQYPEQVTQAVISSFSPKPILVVGDLILDRYLWGKVKRISPEAPVPVVELLRQEARGGGAANVALNLAGLGLHTLLAGWTGADPERNELLGLLQQAQVNTAGILALPQRRTITKTRILAANQQMLRIDQEDTQALSETEVSLLLQALAPHWPTLGAIIISDYAKGTITAELCQALIQQAKTAAIPILIDPKGSQYHKYQGATAITPNRHELAVATQTDEQDWTALSQAGQALRQTLQLDYLLVTLSEQGMALLAEDIILAPAMAREVYDVSGAGDTVIATLMAGTLADLSQRDRLHLANLAAGVVVAKVGTVPISKAELLDALALESSTEQSHKLCLLPELLRRLPQWRAQGERIVFTNGCFDLLHVGHVSYLEKAKQQGQRLIIGVNSDASVRRLKGNTRPVIKENERARLLAALAVVDAVIIFNEDTPLALIEAIRPEVLAKGADYTEAQVVGGTAVKSWGGQVVLIELVAGVSTTQTIAHLQQLQT